MSNNGNGKRETHSRSFITHDGVDENGVRAEVEVTVGTARVSKIDKRESSAKIEFKIEYLKFPIGAWVNMDTPVFELAQKAYENQELVDFRIEQYRKRFDSKTHEPIDRSIPLDVLLGKNDSNGSRDKDLAIQRTKRIVAGIGFVGSEFVLNTGAHGEAVTNPREDPQYGGSKTYSALDNPVQPHTQNDVKNDEREVALALYGAFMRGNKRMNEGNLQALYSHTIKLVRGITRELDSENKNIADDSQFAQTSVLYRDVLRSAITVLSIKSVDINSQNELDEYTAFMTRRIKDMMNYVMIVEPYESADHTGISPVQESQAGANAPTQPAPQVDTLHAPVLEDNVF